MAYISQILHRTFKNLISTCSLDWAESSGIGHAHFRHTTICWINTKFGTIILSALLRSADKEFIFMEMKFIEVL